MTRNQLLSIVATLALAACSGKSKGGATPPGGGDTDTAPDAGAAVVAPPIDGAPAPDPKAELLAAEKTAYEAAESVFLTRCGNCHLQGGVKATDKKLEHLDITSYPFTGKHADTITETIRHVLGIDGSKATMPKDKPGSLKAGDLDLIKAWADAYDAAEAGGAHGD
jgi:hypothetical protein